MRIYLLSVYCSLTIAACTSIEDITGSNPIIDDKNVNLARYEADLAECRNYADEVAIAQKAGSGVVSGAVVGAAIGAVVGNSDVVKKGAGIGAVGGGARGIGEGIRERDNVIKRCLTGRGYRVLN